MARGPRGRRAFTIGSVLSRSFGIWGRNIIPFTLLAVIVYSPLLVYTYVTFRERPLPESTVAAYPTESDPDGYLEDYPDEPRFLTRGPTRAELQRYNMVVRFGSRLFDLILAGAVVFGVFQQVRGKPASLAENVRVGVVRLLPVLGVAVVVSVLVGLGTLALIIPGIILNLMFWVAVPVAVVEKKGVIESIKRSMYLTTGEKGTIFILLLVLGLIQIAAGIVVGVFMASASRTGLATALIPLAFVIPLGALSAVANAVGYHDLRVSKEGVGIEDLVSVFD